MKTLSISIFLLLLISLHSFSQKKREEEIFTAVEQQAEFPGGMGTFGRYLQKNLKWQGDEKEERPSKLYIEFVIEKDGSTSNFSIKSVSKELNVKTKKHIEEILSKVKWKPGYQSGKPVRSRFSIPINHLNYGID